MPHYGVVAFMAASVRCSESVLLLYGGAEALEVQALSLPHVQSCPPWPFPSQSTHLTRHLRGSSFGEDPYSSTH